MIIHHYQKRSKVCSIFFLRGKASKDCVISYSAVSVKNNSNVAADLWDKRPEFTDIVFVIGDWEFPAHKMVLASQSQYFKGMLYGGMQEASVKRIELSEENLTPDAFEKILKYIYTSILDVKKPLDVSMI